MAINLKIYAAFCNNNLKDTYLRNLKIAFESSITCELVKIARWNTSVARCVFVISSPYTLCVCHRGWNFRGSQTCAFIQMPSSSLKVVAF